jgi:hypothetical protein
MLLIKSDVPGIFVCNALETIFYSSGQFLQQRLGLIEIARVERFQRHCWCELAR